MNDAGAPVLNGDLGERHGRMLPVPMGVTGRPVKLIGGVDRTTRTADLGMVELTPGALGLDVEGGLIALSSRG